MYTCTCAIVELCVENAANQITSMFKYMCLCIGVVKCHFEYELNWFNTIVYYAHLLTNYNCVFYFVHKNNFIPEPDLKWVKKETQPDGRNMRTNMIQ